MCLITQLLNTCLIHVFNTHVLNTCLLFGFCLFRQSGKVCEVPLMARIIGTSLMNLQPVCSCFLCSSLFPLGPAKLQASPFPAVVVCPHLHLSALLSPPLLWACSLAWRSEIPRGQQKTGITGENQLHSNLWRPNNPRD